MQSVLSREALFYNAVCRATHADHHALKKMKEGCGTWETAWGSLPNPLLARTVDPEYEEEALLKNDIRLVLKDEAGYPSLLSEIPWPPLGIYIKGALPSPEIPMLAIVGTRRATTAGKELASRFAEALGQNGISVVSGLALGIDAKSHEGCLKSGAKTVAVLAHGLDKVYPKMNESLAARILEEGGALISEYPMETESYPSHFIERNRIVSGLSRGVLVIEAPENSGSLATARFALDQNREVFVIPGPVTHPNFKGSHALIRAGAELVTSPEDILASLGLSPAKTERTLFEGTPEESLILKMLEREGIPLSVDKLLELTNLKAPEINQALGFLVIKGLIKEYGETYCLA